ncbi:MULTISPECIES: primosomal protein N' [Sphingobium]|jgi:primosomal protein N' (replication factor Y)|uniref:Replication restart protein PriA n=1 Tax=Sphingobium limneticum TaxID=1007511 RepID=A0A5J5I7Z9_9SPHN|nr:MULTISPECIES: primosomal protein N' [Sphingobium]MBU0932781.1 primosomal protein N' [Alphaproteobacteria bacterium]KAA9019049.1 primosomal protein N' [Sphingobium limneticum]KAA9019567.1 primosomal protein N' [Sphingobium limneticum]KAA9032025.1 primosomal protein N' [Sphingobium limneticum]BBC98891.1 primosomal protein N' [Sphingobium sp. YG1]
MSRARVLILNAALGPLDYRVPHGMTVKPGSIVVAPLGPRQLIGVVWEEDSFPDIETVGDNRLRNLLEVVDAPPLPETLRRLIEWTADYYLAPPAAVLRMALSSMAALEGARTVIEYKATGAVPDRMTEQRTQALERIGERQGLIRELAMIGGVSDAVIRGLIKQDIFEPVEVSVDTPFPMPDPAHAQPILSEAQTSAAEQMADAVRAHDFAPFLLDGVTGSGKTEVYFEAIAAAIRADRQVLVLLPEIALTEPFLERFEKRFGTIPVNWHSGLRQTERRRAWRAIASGQAQVVVGARSALFLPYPNLGLIVVDEAHEASFKQEDGVHYHARDVAVMRGLIEKFPVILASATPAIETRHQVELGRYAEIKLPSRFGGAQMPGIEGVNLLTDPPERGRWIAPPLVKAIDEVMAKGEQSLLFLNRRGYAPLTLCRHCGYRFQCPNCTAWMVEHRLTHRLACHHCGHVIPAPRRCPDCKEEDSLVACGPGVERIADEVKALWPQARIALATSDTLWSPARAADFVKSVEAGDVDIIVGTQLVTKGYHFPNLTLVGVIDADLGLEGGDLRAAERTFQQIVQVAGRAGRGEKPGKVYIQTRMPGSEVIQSLIEGDTERFYAVETENRRRANAPPFGRFAAIIVSSEDADEAAQTARLIGKSAPVIEGMRVYGPAPAPLSVLRGRHRHRLLIHATRQVDVQAAIREWLGNLAWKSGTRVAVDVDPYSFM